MVVGGVARSTKPNVQSAGLMFGAAPGFTASVLFGTDVVAVSLLKDGFFSTGRSTASLPPIFVSSSGSKRSSSLLLLCSVV